MAGFNVAIYERTDKLEEFGAGLQITPNATRILAQLGVLERVRRLSSKPPAVLVLRGSDNAKLMRLPLDDAERRWGAEYLVIHRADLQTALVEAVSAQSGIEFSLGTTVTGFAANGDTISVRLQRGLTAARDQADLLIGADGLRSQVRSGLGFGQPDRPTLLDASPIAPLSMPRTLNLAGREAKLFCVWDLRRIWFSIPCGAD